MKGLYLQPISYNSPSLLPIITGLNRTFILKSFPKFQDPGGQEVGFLLGSCGITWVFTTEMCFKTLPKDDTGNVVHFKGQFFLPSSSASMMM